MTSLPRMAIAVLAAVGLFVGGQQVTHEDTPNITGTLASLKVAPAANARTYKRAKFGTGWIDVDHDCKDTRAEVLERDLTDPKVVGCRVVSGHFSDPYSGVSGDAQASALDIDHVVSLGDAWRSGASSTSSWSAARRLAYANDLTNLLATNHTANNCKSDKGPAEWDQLPVSGGRRVCDRQRAPVKPALRCHYARVYVSTKARWGLTVTEQDRDTLARMLADC